MPGQATRRQAVVGLAGALPGVLLLAEAPATVGAQAVDLAPTGQLRVAIDRGNTALATRDPASGEWRGVFVDLARALAQRLGIPVAFVEYASFGERDAPAEAGAWDVASDARSPEEAAARGWAVAIPYLDIDLTLVVGPTSPLRSVADMHRPGVRIGAPTGTTSERLLSARLQQAEMVRAATPADVVPLLRAGQVDALASNRPNVIALAAQVPGARVLADRFAVSQQRLTLAPGRPATALAVASEVTRQALASGLIRASIERNGTVGVQPAPLTSTTPGGLPRTGGVPSQPAWTAAAGLAAAAGLLVATRRRPRR